MNYVTVLLHRQHQKKAFSCGNTVLDAYLHRQANQDVKRKLAVCFVWPDANTHSVKGYYTLSNSSIALHALPPEISKKLPNYTAVPTTLLGRLAIDKNYQRQGMGKILLVDALRRSLEVSTSLGSYAVVVDPIYPEAETYYQRFGFITLPDSGKMMLAMKTIRDAFGD